MPNCKFISCSIGYLGFLTALCFANPLLAQESTTPPPSEITPVPSAVPEEVTPPADSTTETSQNSILSLQGGQKLMSEADAAINAQNYDVAANKLQQARQVFNQLSNFYLQLFDSFSGIDNRIAESQRQKALETGQMRDNATYQLALVHRAQNKSELSVPLLIQVINSQNPRSELGAKAYQQLFEIGFVEEPPTAESGS